MILPRLIQDLGNLFQQEGGLVEPPLVLHEGLAEGRFGGLRLSSVFRRIRHASTPALVAGLQAGLRVSAEGEGPASALDVFAAAQDTGLVINLDRLCRTLHLLNFLPLAGEVPYLFLHVNPYHVMGIKHNHGAYFEEILARCGLTPAQVVITLSLGLSASPYSEVLAHGLGNYRARGYGLALQFERKPGYEGRNREFVCTLRPDYLFVPHGFGSGADRTDAEEQLARLIASANQSGARVVVNGIDTAEQAELSFAARADYVQGNYFETTRHSQLELTYDKPVPVQNTTVNHNPSDYVDRYRSESTTLSLLGRRWQYS